MENLSDADLKKIVDEVVSSLTREMPSKMDKDLSSAPAMALEMPVEGQKNDCYRR